ncbi:MAG: choice-of-anchor Q domain-containing protein [Anaerolineae bacterium]|nr:choice-of-anchor Q domain-containing protein [Anaerolineae bacterium]
MHTKTTTIIKLLLGAITTLAALLLAGRAHADTITVTIGFDRFDETATADCSLREAIQAANTNASFAGCQHSGGDPNDVIVFDSAVSTAFITRTVSGDNNDNTSGDLDAYVGSVSGTLVIRGPATVLVQNLFDRAFDVRPDSSGSGAFSLEAITVSGGDLRLDLTSDDAVITNAQLECVYGGGGVRVHSGVTATLDGVVVSENAAAYAGGGVCAKEGASLIISGTQLLSNTVGLSGSTQVNWVAGGGGLWSSAPLVMTNSFVISNRVVLSGGFYSFAGGGGIGVITGDLSIMGSVVSYNRVEQSADAEAQGGGIMAGRWAGPLAQVLLRGVRIEGNQSLSGATSYGGGVALLRGVQALITGGSIISGNVLSATQGAAGGGLAVGLNFWPSDYQPPIVEMDGGVVRNNRATASAASVAGAVTPTVFGGGAFLGVGTVFTVTGISVDNNAVRYIGASVTNTNGFGGGISAFAHGGGRVSNSQVLSNAVRGFRFASGGGLHVGGDGFLLSNTAVSANVAESSTDADAGALGGGAFINWGESHFTDAQIFGNVITGVLYASGGGIAVDGRLYVTSTAIGANHGRAGGGLFVNSGSVAHVESSNIVSNTAESDGGGVQVNGTLFITRTAVVTNTALQGGGLGLSSAALLHGRKITVAHNLATGTNYAQGGGLFGGGSAFVSDSRIAHNRAVAPNYAAGGGVYRYGGVFHVSDSQLSDNLASSNGDVKAGGWYGSDSTAYMTNTLIARNVASATNLALGGGIWITNTTLALSNVDVLTNTARSLNSVAKGGAGVQESQTTLTLINGRVQDNQARSQNASAYAGGFDVASTSKLFITTTRVVSNAAVGDNASGSGGIGNNGVLRIVTSTVSSNKALSVTTGQPVGAGGGIGNGGTLHIAASSIVSNVAATGAGLNTYGAAQTHILNSTLSGNQSNPGTNIGGAILTGTAYLTHTTVASNTGAGLAIGGSGLVIRATAVAHHAGNNCVSWGGSVSNSDYSVSDDTTCATFFAGTNALNNTPFMRLGPLTFHSATGTWYHPTLVGSLLHERVPAGDCPLTDQLGQPRPGVLHCDTGAFELQSFYRVFAPIVRRP